jgi:hypothetical protein
MPRDFLFGLVRVPMWDYYWGLTAAQVELLTIDQPIVVYKKEKREAPWKDGKVSEDYADKQYRKWLERKKQREREGKTVDLEKTFANGQKVDMQTFLKTGEKKETE